MILVKLMTDEKGLTAFMKINPDMMPDKCPKNEACGTRSCIIISSAQGAILSGTVKKPKSSEICNRNIIKLN